MTSVTPTPQGYSPAEPICKLLKNDLATAASPTTEGYLHTLPDADETALSTIRNHSN
jgi:hypothetical protein